MVEPHIRIVGLLIAQIATDWNTTRDSVTSAIWPDWPREDLTKNSYPRVSVIQVTETGDDMGINTTALLHHYIIQIDVWLWDKTSDPHLVTVGGVVMSGAKARDNVTREIINELRNHFYSDTNLSGCTNFVIRANRAMPYDEKRGAMRRLIEISFDEPMTS